MALPPHERGPICKMAEFSKKIKNSLPPHKWKKNLLSDSIVYFKKKLDIWLWLWILFYFSIGNRAFEFFKYILESINPSMYICIFTGLWIRSVGPRAGQILRYSNYEKVLRYSSFLFPYIYARRLYDYNDGRIGNNFIKN